MNSIHLVLFVSAWAITLSCDLALRRPLLALNVTPADFDSFSAVMGDKGGSGGCWCMLWRAKSKAYEAQKGERNHKAMKARFAGSQRAPGLIAWVDEQPVGWIQVDKRDAFVRLTTSRVLKPVDDEPVWSVACFLVHKPYRGKGVARALLDGACSFAAQHGATTVEGYPIDPPKKYTPTFAYTGFLGTFRDAGFVEVARRSPTRPIMRRSLSPGADVPMASARP